MIFIVIFGDSAVFEGLGSEFRVSGCLFSGNVVQCRQLLKVWRNDGIVV